jgi:hypothetical protein
MNRQSIMAESVPQNKTRSAKGLRFGDARWADGGQSLSNLWAIAHSSCGPVLQAIYGEGGITGQSWRDESRWGSVCSGKADEARSVALGEI